MTDNSRKTVKARIEGKVQGVWYRAWTEREALSLGLSGHVRNMSDGSVEAVFHGRAEEVDEMIRRCHEGPPAARVNAVLTDTVPAPESSGFRVLGDG